MIYKTLDEWLDEIEITGTRYDRLLYTFPLQYTDHEMLNKWLQAAWDCSRMDNAETVQELLDKEAILCNERIAVHNKIKQMRGEEPPVCWGHDDCSTNILMRCPWRIDCESKGI